MKRKLRKGFTIIELMIVVGILVILASLAVPSYTQYTKSARRAKCISCLRTIHEAKFAWAVANPSGTLTDLAGLASAGYFRGATDAGTPTCPSGGAYSYESERTNIGVKPTCSWGTSDGTDFNHTL